MSSPEPEIDALKAQLAALAARMDRLEQRAGTARETPIEVVAPAQPVPPAATPQPQAAPRLADLSWKTAPVARPFSDSIKEHDDLEKKIGQYWLNRIGIIAMLFGVSYFLKYA